MRAVISPEFTSLTLNTFTSAACVLPVDWLSEASGGEITTFAPSLKLAPTSGICTWLAPRTGNPGVALVKTGAGPGAATVNVTVFEGSGPPGAERSITWTGSCPAVVIRAAGTVASNCVAVIDDGTIEVPFTWTVDVVLKSVPFTVNVKAGLPAVTVLGLMFVIVGFCANAGVPIAMNKSRSAGLNRADTPTPSRLP
jgi:hypothetical protein